MINSKKQNHKLDPNVWVSTLHNLENHNQDHKLDPNIWVNTLPKKKNNNQIIKYGLLSVIFIVGLVLVSSIKNETRNLQKKIDNLRTSVNSLKFDLHQATLDHEVITSPQNISKLAKAFLDYDLSPYKKSQIKKITDTEARIINIKKVQNKSDKPTKVAKIISKTKVEIKKLQNLYSNPKKIPGEIKIKIAKKIEQKKNILQQLYDSPGKVITKERVVNWSAIQLVKVFLGIPIIPGK